MAVLLLWIFYVFLCLVTVCYAFVRVCLFVPCGHLLGKGWPLGSRLWCLTVSLSHSHWYLGSGVVLNCIDSWSLHPYLLWSNSVYAQADLRLCWSHIPHCFKSHVTAHFSIPSLSKATELSYSYPILSFVAYNPVWNGDDNIGTRYRYM